MEEIEIIRSGRTAGDARPRTRPERASRALIDDIMGRRARGETFQQIGAALNMTRNSISGVVFRETSGVYRAQREAITAAQTARRRLHVAAPDLLEALKPFASNPKAESLREALGHITRHDLQRAASAVAQAMGAEQ